MLLVLPTESDSLWEQSPEPGCGSCSVNWWEVILGDAAQQRLGVAQMQALAQEGRSKA